MYPVYFVYYVTSLYLLLWIPAFAGMTVVHGDFYASLGRYATCYEWTVSPS